MGAQSLGSRAIIGMMYKRLSESGNMGWANLISMYFMSDQEKEDYKWLGMSPVMREWEDGRKAVGLKEEGITIHNKEFEATIDIPTSWMRRDKTGQIQVRINDLVRRTETHWKLLLSALINAGESTLCYDGQYFYDTDHQEGSSGVQSNLIDCDISEYAVADHGGSVTQPSVDEFLHAILDVVSEIINFKDDRGEPMNDDAESFLVMVPKGYWKVAQAAIASGLTNRGQTNPVAVMDGLKLSVATNPRLTWTDRFSVFRTDSEVKPFILQEEQAVNISAKAEGSEYEHDYKRHQYGVDAIRNVGMAFWQMAAMGKLI